MSISRKELDTFIQSTLTPVENKCEEFSQNMDAVREYVNDIMTKYKEIIAVTSQCEQALKQPNVDPEQVIADLQKIASTCRQFAELGNRFNEDQQQGFIKRFYSEKDRLLVLYVEAIKSLQGFKTPVPSDQTYINKLANVSEGNYQVTADLFSVFDKFLQMNRISGHIIDCMSRTRQAHADAKAIKARQSIDSSPSHSDSTTLDTGSNTSSPSSSPSKASSSNSSFDKKSAATIVGDNRFSQFNTTPPTPPADSTNKQKKQKKSGGCNIM